MTKLLLVSVLTALATGPLTFAPSPKQESASSPKLPASTAPAKPTELFANGSLVAWEYVAGAPADISQVLSADGGVIKVTGKPNGYVSTRDAYRDYTLHVEWRWTGPAPNSGINGGILAHVVSGPVQQNLWPTSFQVQLKVQRAGDILNMGEARFAETPTTIGTAASPSSTLARREESSEKPFGEWNTADLAVRGSTIEATINGVLQNRVTGCVPSSGRIGFQLEGHPFELRNVRIAPLPS